MTARIAHVTATPVRVPLKSPLRTALGAAAVSEYGIVQVCSDDGLEGLGEVSLIWHGNGARLCRDLTELVSPAIIGMPIMDRAAVMSRAAGQLQFGRHSLPALAGLEMALFDLAGRTVKQPVVNLLGGPVRDKIELSMSLSIAPLTDLLAEARRYVEAGFRTLKIKGDRDLDRVVDAAAALRLEFGPALTLRVDLNMAWRDRKQALAAIRRLEPFDIVSVEQPLPAEDLVGAAFLTEHSPIPIMLDESVWTVRDAQRVIADHAADLVNIYVSEAGGLTQAFQIAQLCELNGLGVAVGSMPELAIGTSAAAHLAFALPRLDHPSDVSGFLYHEGDVVLHQLKIADGCLLSPTSDPGLGLELDTDRLAYYRMDL